MKSVRTTLLSPGLWVGVLGTLVIAAGELRRLSETKSLARTGWAIWLQGVVTVPYATLVAIGIAGLALGWLMLRPSAGRPAISVPLVVAIWTVPLLFGPPMLSTDAGSYADLGWMVMRGDNPYVTGLGTTGSPFEYGRAWRGTTSVYPAPALALLGWVVQVTGANWAWSIIGIRLLAVAGAGMLLWAVPKLARRVGVDPIFATWIAVANPVTMVHGIGGAHLDLLMTGLVAVAAVLAGRRWGIITAGLVLGLAIGIKQPAVLAVPAVAVLTLGTQRRSWPKVIVAGLWVTGIATVTFAALSLATGLGFGWINGTGTPSSGRATLTPAWLVSQVLSINPARVTTWGQWLAGVVIVVTFVWIGRRDPLRFLAIAALTWALGFGVLREWYLIFPLAFLGLARPGPVLRGSIWVGAPFFALYGTWKEYQRASITGAAISALIWALVIAGIGLAWWLITTRRPATVKPHATPALEPTRTG